MRAALFLAVLVLFANAHALNLAPATGAYQTQNAEYKFPASVDPDVLDSVATEIWARAFWPKDLSRPRPILFLLHGNHGTCGDSSSPRNDWDCSYTQSGTCPAGQIVVPNHDGYKYLGEALSAQGYIVVSINANRGITCGEGDDLDFGLNLARGRLILRHIEKWKKWATHGGAPQGIGATPNEFVGKVDFSNVGLMGHSRGGEGARAAYTIFRETNSPWPARIPGLEIRGIFEIGAVDGQTSRVLNAEDTAWVQLLPMCDGDVSDLQGRLPFERMLLKPRETRMTSKSLLMVWGTNHNFYNTEWQSSDSYGCTGHNAVYGDGPTSEIQQTIAVQTMSAFFNSHLGFSRNASLSDLFDPSKEIPASWIAKTRIDRDHYYTNDESFSIRVEDFNRPTGTNSSNTANEATGVKVEHNHDELPNRAEVSWESAADTNFFQVNWTAHGSGRPIAAYTSLDFRVGRTYKHVDDVVATDFSVQLVADNGAFSVSVPLSRFAQLVGPANDIQTYQTVRIPLSEFGAFTNHMIRGVRFVFNRSQKATIAFANVRFTMFSPDDFEQSRNLPLATLDPVLKDQGDESSEQSNHNNRGNEAANNGAGNSGHLPEPAPEAFISSVQANDRSRALHGERAVEMNIVSETRFPVGAQLPTLVIAKNKYSISRFNRGQTSSIVFTIPRDEFNRLPMNGKMQVQYGRDNALKVWKMKDFDKQRWGF